MFDSDYKRRPMYYYLSADRQPMPVDDVLTWAKCFENIDNRKVAETKINNSVWVSTVFLGLDHNFTATGPPLLFETMLFSKGFEDEGCWRCSTWTEAERQHKAVVRLCRWRMRRPVKDRKTTQP